MHIFVGKKFKNIEASLLLYLVRKLLDRFSVSQLKVNIVSENIHKDLLVKTQVVAGVILSNLTIRESVIFLVIGIH
mgnify:CR=1 FL=1